MKRRDFLTLTAGAVGGAAASSLPSFWVPTLQATTRSIADFGSVPDQDSTAAIQMALDAAGMDGGGTVHIPAGTYWLSMGVHPQAGWGNALRVPSNVALVGEGPEISILKLMPMSRAGRVIQNQNIDGSSHDVRLRFADFTLNGNASQQSELHSGLEMMRMSWASHTRVWVRSIRGTGDGPNNGETFAVHSTMSAETSYYNCVADGQSSDETATGFGASAVTNVLYHGCRAYNLKHGAGFALWETHGGAVVSCYAQRMWTGNGMNLEWSDQTRIANTVFGGDATDHPEGRPYQPGQSLGNGGIGLKILDSRRTTIVGCISRGNGSDFQHIGIGAGSTRKVGNLGI